MRRWTSFGVGAALVIAALAVVIVVLVAARLPGALPVRSTPTATPTPSVDWAGVRPGSDASWPVCTPPHGTKAVLPLAAAPAFAIVGVNDGLPGTESACIARELAWSDTATGGSSRPGLEYYVLAADPWTASQRKWVPQPTWPTSDRVGGVDVRVPAAFASALHGTTCTGGHAERACAYVYGWIMAQGDAALPGLRAPDRHRFWIDVEAVDGWSEDELFDQAVVEGMAAAFTSSSAEGGVGTTVGLYSDHGEWDRIMGVLRPGSPLDALDEWLAIGRAGKADAADALVQGVPLTPGGRIVLVQYLDGGIDLDLARPAP